MTKSKLLCLVLALCLLLFCGTALAEPDISNAGMAKLLTQMYQKGLSGLSVGDAFGAYLITAQEDGSAKVVYTLENGDDTISQESYNAALAAFLKDANAANDVLLVRPDENGTVNLPEDGTAYALVLLNTDETFTINGNFQGEVVCLSLGESTPAPAATATPTATPTPCNAHKWDKGTVTAEETCTKNGQMSYTCTVCGATKTEVLPALGHDYYLIAAKEAGCETDGYRTYRCAVCQDTYTDILPAHGHSFNAMGICIYCGMGK